MSNVAPLEHSVYNRALKEETKQLKTYYDAKYKTSWCLMKAEPRPCFTNQLLSEFHEYIRVVKQDMRDSQGEKYDYIVVGSDVDGVFNLGGDLNLFRNYIESNNRDGLFNYAIRCIDILHENISHLDCDLTTIALVQGDALGGGFESALASNVVIAEKGVKMGLPEVLFNLFPGMGAYSLLSRRVGTARAEQMILSGRLYTSDELVEAVLLDQRVTAVVVTTPVVPDFLKVELPERRRGEVATLEEPVIHAGREIGQVRVEMDTGALASLVHGQWQRTMLTGLLQLAIGLGIMFALLRLKVLEPV